MIRLRPVTVVDVRALGELTHRCDATQRDWAGPETPVPSTAEQEAGWHTRLVRAGAWAIGAVDEDGRLIGACAFARGRESRDEGAFVPGLAHISAVFVDPAHWRRGIARMLLDATEREMLAQGYTDARLHTLEGSPAEQLYAALGWTRTDERQHFPLMDLPTITYVKALGPRA